MTTLSEELTWRGMVNQMTFANITDLDKETRTFYFGVDPSANSMTIGNLAAAMMVRQFMEHGYKAILLVGGATGLIGDPDGKKQERDLKTREAITANVEGISAQYKNLFEGMNFEVVDNYDWFKDIHYLDFLRDVGKYVSLTQMLDRDFVKDRIGEGGSGISYAEFSYTLIQGYDYLHLFREKNATMQMGGSDQWGNMIAGTQLIRRIEGAEAHVFSTPLVINKQTGVKFGKSEGGAVWLDPAQTSPYKFYQFWLNVDDETAEDLVKIYTLLDKQTIDDLIANHRENRSARVLQRELAYRVTELVHGQSVADKVRRATKVLFNEDGVELSSLTSEEVDMLAAELPSAERGNIIDVLVSAGIAASKGEAKRLLAGGGVAVNGQKVDDTYEITDTSLVKKGKNNFVLVR
ncbi:MAG TPA: tyrosine--tRNA ligase [Patescibacteria group bacterium]|nr:tyrosine--tRNA ligase [Patescibacteria group bacterium]